MLELVDAKVGFSSEARGDGDGGGIWWYLSNPTVARTKEPPETAC